MKMTDALETLKAKGITKLTGMYNQTDIDVYIDNAHQGDENAAEVLSRYPDMSWAQYHMDHIDGHYIVETNGHHIIVTNYDTFDLPTYGDYDNAEDMRADFDAWRIMRDAEKIADEMLLTRPGELPRAAWVLIAANELRAASKAADEAFEREYGKEAFPNG